MPVSDSPELSVADLERVGLVVPEVRFADQVDQFALADQANPPPTGGVLFIGDSDIRCWTLQGQFASDFAGLPVANRGFGGARTWEVLLSFGRLVLPHRPRVVVYCCGDNDIARLKEAGVASAVTGFRLFLKLAEVRLPQLARVFYLAIHPSPGDQPLWPLIEQANRLIRPLCGGESPAEFVDFLHLLHDGQGRLRADAFLPDRLHFTPGFYRQLAAFLRPRLETALGRDLPVPE